MYNTVTNIYEGGELTIASVTVRQNGIQTIALTEEELQQYFTGNEHLQFAENTGFTFVVTGEDPQLLPTAEFQQLYSQNSWAVILLGALSFGGIGALLLAFLIWFAGEIRTYTVPQKLVNYLFLGSLLAAGLMCIYVGLRSPFWLNPDEYDVKAAVNYYFTHFMPPDIRSDLITDSFPVYGTFRHFEFNMFYF